MGYTAYKVNDVDKIFIPDPTGGGVDGYDTVTNDSVPVVQRHILTFDGFFLTAEDSPGNLATNIIVANLLPLAGGTMTGNILFDENGEGGPIGIDATVDLGQLNIGAANASEIVIGNVAHTSTINIVSTAINLLGTVFTHSIQPTADNTYSVGSSVTRWVSVNSKAFLGVFATTDNLNQNQTAGLTLRNDKAAAAGAGNQQYSPGIDLRGNQWNGAASVPVDWLIQQRPITGNSTTAGDLVFWESYNSGAYVEKMSFVGAGAMDYADGQTAATSATSHGRFRYNDATKFMEVSNNGGAYTKINAVGNLTVQGFQATSSVLAATVNSLKTAAAIANGVLGGVTQPDTPRPITFTVTDANASITAGTIAVVGVDAGGVAINQTFNIANGGTHTYTTTKAYATFSSITVAGVVGNTGADTLSVGLTNSIGLSVNSGFSSLVVYKIIDLGNGVDVSGFGTDTVNALVTGLTPGSGTEYLISYTYISGS